MQTHDNVIDLDSARADRESGYPLVQVIDRLATSGASPFLALASDGEYYWCKALRNEHGPEAVVNEVVASIIGETIKAPVRPWKILRVPEEFHGQLIEGRKRIDAGLVFGSLNLHTGDLDRMDPVVPYVELDGNYNRLPNLIALWALCNAEDLQVLFDADEDMQVWSIDHGFWFGSYEKPWGLGDPSERVGRTIIPSLASPIPEKNWNRAIENIDLLNGDVQKTATEVIPEEWRIPKEEISKLVKYAIGRKSYAIGTLEKLRDYAGRR